MECCEYSSWNLQAQKGINYGCKKFCISGLNSLSNYITFCLIFDLKKIIKSGTGSEAMGAGSDVIKSIKAGT